MHSKKEIAAARKVLRARGVNSLLSVGTNPKTAKSDASGKGYLTAILYGAPATLSGYNTCASATAACIAGCLHRAGNPVYMRGKEKARIARTRAFFEVRDAFFIVLWAELQAFRTKCRKYDLRPAVRLNGTTDIVWERVAPWIFTEFADVVFYDYTKHAKRMRKGWTMPANYLLTFSRSDENEQQVLEILAENASAKVAIVFSTKRGQKLPSEWNGYPVGDADTDDLRFLDLLPIAGLRAKGPAIKDVSGFVVRV
jgi:hypothetical protein